MKYTFPNILIVSWEDVMKKTQNITIQQPVDIVQVKKPNKIKNINYNKVNTNLIKTIEHDIKSDDQLSKHFNALDELTEFTKYY